MPLSALNVFVVFRRYLYLSVTALHSDYCRIVLFVHVVCGVCTEEARTEILYSRHEHVLTSD